MCLSPAQADVKAFRDAFALRSDDVASAKPDAGVIKAMDILIDKLRKDTNNGSTGEDIENMLGPYSRAIAAEEIFPTTYPSLSGAVTRFRGRVAVSVRMGAVSRMRVFELSSGKVVPVDKAFDWMYQYDAQPNSTFDGGIVVNAPGIQDAGVRYGYRVYFLKPSAGKYITTKRFDGVWVLEDESNSHFSQPGAEVVLHTLDVPLSYFTSSPEKLFIRKVTYSVRLGTPTLVSEQKEQPSMRALDAWMAKAMKNPQTTLEKSFKKAYGTERQMLEGWSSKKDGANEKITLNLEEKFVFTIRKQGSSYSVLSFAKN
ncbi:MAG: hypothetical protein BGO01_04765 [Armatimonadetes bacterium 55-13]|nr:MAG: hypothetical protein BGO01_04765 [Armatimonadetes bacterium 55-13]